MVVVLGYCLNSGWSTLADFVYSIPERKRQCERREGIVDLGVARLLATFWRSRDQAPLGNAYPRSSASEGGKSTRRCPTATDLNSDGMAISRVNRYRAGTRRSRSFADRCIQPGAWRRDHKIHVRLGGAGWPALGPTRVQRTRGYLADLPRGNDLFRLRRPGRLKAANLGHLADTIQRLRNLATT